MSKVPVTCVPDPAIYPVPDPSVPPNYFGNSTDGYKVADPLDSPITLTLRDLLTIGGKEFAFAIIDLDKADRVSRAIEREERRAENRRNAIAREGR